jgi:hypothetical protein
MIWKLLLESTDGQQHHDMYVGVEFKFEGLDLVSPF